MKSRGGGLLNSQFDEIFLHMSNTIHLHSGWELSEIIADLKEAKNDRNILNLTMYNLDVEEVLVSALEETLLVKNKKWHRIEILGCMGRMDLLLACIFRMSDLQELILQHDHMDHYDLTVYVALGMGLSSTSSVRVLRLYQSDLSSSYVWALGQGLRVNQFLQELDLNYCRLVGDVAEMLGEALSANTYLRKILLNGCQLDDNHAAQLVQALEHHPKLEWLEMYQNTCRFNTMMAVATLLQRSECPLHKLDLHCQRVQKGERLLRNSSSALYASLRTNSSLQVLNLSENGLDDQDMDSIVLILQEPTSALLELDFSRNRITDKGMKRFANALPFCRVLKRLHLHGNDDIGDEGLQAVATSMRDNMELEELNINTSASPSAVKDIQYYTCLNKGGRKLLLQTDFPPSLWAVVLERANTLTFTSSYTELTNAPIDVTFCLLQGPALLEQRQ